MHNDLELVRFLLNNKEKELTRNHTDNEGKNAIHYVVNPAKFGSFENLTMLNALIGTNSFFDLNQRDKSGKTPLDYALL
jgi:ankyrin repeat protein